MRRPKTSRRQAGDTIVEVLIAIAVIATILAGAFVLSRNSLKQVRDSEERAQATNLLHGQIEQLRAIGNGGDHEVQTEIKSGMKFCLSGAALAPSANCQHMGDNGLYTVVMQTDPTPTSAGTYTVTGTVTWPSVNGNTSRVQLVYRATIQ